MLLFLSIVAITMMGVATYLSIHFSVLGIGRNTSDRYAELHFRDFEVISTKLLSPADLDAIRGLEGVAAAEPVWQTVGKAGSGEENEDVTVISITEEVNLPMVLEGRLPEDPGECAVEKRLMDKFGWAIGETIAVTSADGEMPQYLLNSTFRITCVANHPDHMNTAAPDTLYIMLPRRAFDLDALENCSVKAEIILEKGADLSLFEEEYTSLADGMKKNLEALASEREQIRDREVLAKALSELDENAKMVDLKKMLSDAEETLDALQPARWILLRVMDNTSFAWQHGIITQTSQIQAVFSTFFLIISILVIYASVQKLVLEQRTLVGMGKALGLYNREILLKYLLFGLLGTTAGIILGTAAAYFVLQPLVLGTTNLFVLFDISRPLFDARSVLLTAAFLELVTFLSVYVACKALLRSSATVLIRTQVPKYQNKAAGRGSRHIPLMIRMIPRGMRANPGRVLVTVVSVAGCCALVVMGLTTKNRLDGVLTHQYPGITDYDLEVTFDGSADARDGIEEVLRSEGTEYVLVGSESVICEENGRTAAVLVTGSLEEIDAFYHLRDHHTGEPLPLNRKGCYIHRCFAEEFQLSPGDTVAVTLGLDTQARFSVGAVYDNYLGWNFFLCDADYEEAFGKASTKNQYYVRLGAADEALLKERLAKVPGFGKIDASDSDKEIFLSVSSTMNMLVVLMIVLAGILAAFVIVSLTKCYLLQKNNEAMIMRINGFTFREVIIYLMAEIIADTILGILLGFVVGQVLSVYMLSQMEADFYRTIRGIDVPAMILGAGITALFSLAVNAVCLRPLKRMKLTDLA